MTSIILFLLILLKGSLNASLLTAPHLLADFLRALAILRGFVVVSSFDSFSGFGISGLLTISFSLSATTLVGAGAGSFFASVVSFFANARIGVFIGVFFFNTSKFSICGFSAFKSAIDMLYFLEIAVKVVSRGVVGTFNICPAFSFAVSLSPKYSLNSFSFLKLKALTSLAIVSPFLILYPCISSVFCFFCSVLFKALPPSTLKTIKVSCFSSFTQIQITAFFFRTLKNTVIC